MSDSRTIVISGVTSGLGLALSQHFVETGHRVFGCGRRENPLAHAKSDRFVFRQLDINDADALAGWTAEIQSQERIDLLVHNAAIMQPSANLHEVDLAVVEEVIRINVLGAFQVLQAFLPGMLAAGRGVVVTMSSGAGRHGIPGISSYCASKYAVEGLTKSLAKELPEPLAAIPLAPGMIDTDMLRTNFGDSAGQHQKPSEWAKRAGPMIIGLSREHNGESLTVPED